MLFNSYIFILAFLPVTFAGYFLFNKIRLYRISKLFLLIMSVVFYAYFKPPYAVIIAVSVLFNFFISKLFLVKMKIGALCKKLFLISAILCNVGALVYYKYMDFFISNVNAVFKTEIPLLAILLPLGISFFTFQQLSYIIDCYKGKTPNYGFLDYALYVCFFPQLIAGPIVRHDETIPQFEDKTNSRINFGNLSRGLYAFAFGLAKKVMIADTLGAAANWGFANIEGLGTPNAFIVILCYTLQIYFDFSGYCDMATGIGYMFNIKLPMNFNSPYRARNIDDFWKRWHMTLTRFFTDYIYIPLGGSRKGKVRTYANILIIFLVSGFWHGADWTFILWGAMHGCALAVYRMLKKYIDKIPKIITWVFTFAFVNLTWVFFRANNFKSAMRMFKELFSLNRTMVAKEIREALTLPGFAFVKNWLALPETYTKMIVAAFILFAFAASVFMRNTNERVDSFKPTLRRGVVTVLLTFICIISLDSVSSFLYFNF